ncbi:GntR family transcriptional regulator [Neorhizobium sp. NPDC001467]|uniref:GntR family transcriptional regulator n=1 Tax=Neorhizobium sp. NPDC001467 TaxID=3390595 RepID=UPI003D0957A3
MTSQLAATFGLPATASSANWGGTVQRVYDDLRQRIITIQLPPDTTLFRADLTQTYGVSQTPIREALQRLRQDGLVRIYPQSRTVVTRIDVTQIYEAHFLRVALETEVCRHLASDPDRDPATLSRAREIIDMQRTVIDDPQQIGVFQELDELFHQTLFAGVRRANLHGLVRERSGHLDRIRRLHPPQKGKIASILAGHDAIVEAIDAGHEAAAVNAIREHLSRTVDKVEDMREEFPDYFI